MALRRILHLADLHLGFAHSYLGARGPQRTEEAVQTLERVVDWALNSDNRIGAVLIAGDLFETHQPESLLLGRVIHVLKQIPASGRTLVTVPGNHDEYSYPDSVYRQAPSWPGVLVTCPRLEPVATFDLAGTPCVVHSLAFTAGLSAKRMAAPTPRLPVDQAPEAIDSPQTATDAPRPGIHETPMTGGQQPVAIALLHGTLDADPVDRTYRIDGRTLGEAGFAYAALGHIHKPAELRYSGGVAVYPGTLNGKGFDDPGVAELTVVSFPSGRAHIERIPFPVRTVSARQVDLHRFEDQEQLIHALETDLDGEQIVRLVLEGPRPDDLDPGALQGRLSGRAFHLEIEDASVRASADDLERFEHQPTVRGLFVHLLRERMAAAREAGDARAEELLSQALARGLATFETIARGR